MTIGNPRTGFRPESMCVAMRSHLRVLRELNWDFTHTMEFALIEEGILIALKTVRTRRRISSSAGIAMIDSGGRVARIGAMLARFAYWRVDHALCIYHVSLLVQLANYRLTSDQSGRIDGIGKAKPPENAECSP